MSETTPTEKAAAKAPNRLRMPRWGFWCAGMLLLAGGVALAWGIARNRPAPVQSYEVVNVYPHDANAFTQGLVFDEDGRLYEGTGKEGQSTLRRVELKTGKVLNHYKLDPRLFGEGIAIVGDEIFQLTYKRQLALVYDKKTLRPRKSFPYRGEGWGLTYDGESLIMSNGTSRLYFLNPKTFRMKKFLDVKEGNRDISQLNELEYIEGEIFANVWHSNRIARISPKTGQVLAWIDLRGLLKPGDVTDKEAVLNGIAYDPKTKKLYVTGKNWPKLFEIRVIP